MQTNKQEQPLSVKVKVGSQLLLAMFIHRTLPDTQQQQQPVDLAIWKTGGPNDGQAKDAVRIGILLKNKY